MSKNWYSDINEMHEKFGFFDWISKASKEHIEKYYEFRADFLQEERTELTTATTPDDFVDAIIDMCVIALGTINLYFEDGFDSDNFHELLNHSNLNRYTDWQDARVYVEEIKGFVDKTIKNMLEIPYFESNKKATSMSLESIVYSCVDFLELSGVDFHKAWNLVFDANMSKIAGANPTRKNDLGLPDMQKPKDFKAPDHSDNTGIIECQN